MNLLGHAGQFLVCKRKLESKKDALLILSKELDNCQQERDQYRLMANQLRERHQGLKKKYRELIVRKKHTSEIALFYTFWFRFFQYGLFTHYIPSFYD